VNKVLTATAVLETATGLAMLGFPSLVALLILGTSLEAAVAMAVARVAGVALLALGIACWLARSDEQSPATKGLVVTMVFHNAGIFVVLVCGALMVGLSGVALWPTVIVHATMGIWCMKSLAKRHA